MIDAQDRILIVDDEPAVRDYIATVASKLGFTVRTAGGAEEFSAVLPDFNPCALVLDLNIPGTDGIELVRQLAETGCDAEILLISGEDLRVILAAEKLASSKGLRVAGSLQKPLTLDDLNRSLRHIARRSISGKDLGDAIESGDLFLLYQPKLERKPNGCWWPSGAEALVRWRHAELGVIMPDRFIRIAEDNDLMEPMTDLILRTAIRQSAQWLRSGLDINVAVNFAPHLLKDLQLPDRVADILDGFGVPGSRLTLEITETGAMTDVERTLDILARLRLKGIQLSIDDFGTGYSSLKQIFGMPFTELKIDRSFVMETPSSADARTLVRTMIQLAENFGLAACAEGVEDQEVMDFLTVSGCHRVQGFLFSRPVPADELADFVDTWEIGAHAGRK